MTDPTILFVKPKAISNADKKALKSAGVIVVEVEDPQAVKFVRAGTELSASALLLCAMEAMTKHGGVFGQFGSAVSKTILAAHTDEAKA